MGIFAGLMTYLVAAALLVGGMVAGLAVFFSAPSGTGLSEKPRPPLMRAADRKALEPPKTAASPQSDTPVPGPAVNHRPADAPRLNNAARAKQQAASQPVRKKKAAKPAPREPDTSSLGYGPSEPRKFIFPLDPGW